ncbi:MAG: hypothetical protein U9M90_02385, partial [Patescibacteria group bacterium]|nr:hypothetical protein [Patescibacteria group bacterium]
MNGKERRFGEVLVAFLSGITGDIENIESKVLTMPSKDPEHIFADAEVAGKTTEGRFLREAIVELSDERKRFQTKAKEDKAEVARLKKMH